MKNLSEKLRNEIVAYLEKHQPEVYWDCRDELSSEQTAALFQGEDAFFELECELYDRNRDYICDIENETENELANEFESQICDETGMEREEWEEDFCEWIRDYVSVDLNLKDLLRNTPEDVFFYDTGLEFDGCFGRTPAEIRLDRMIIKKALQITDSRYDREIEELQLNASYGGQLVVYFNERVNDLLDNINSNANMVRFKNAHIALINIGNGSGFDVHLTKHSFALPFDRKNLHYERTIKYNYSFAVCGMVSNWCQYTDYELYHEENAPEAPTSSISAEIERDNNFKAIFNQGKCSLGDADVKRHRRTIYVNEFPCGTLCQDCGHFWVD